MVEMPRLILFGRETFPFSVERYRFFPGRRRLKDDFGVAWSGFAASGLLVAHDDRVLIKSKII